MDPDTDTSLELMNINKAMTTPENVDALLNASPAFKDLDSAVKSMINK